MKKFRHIWYVSDASREAKIFFPLARNPDLHALSRERHVQLLARDDLVVLGGGPDIPPRLYKDKRVKSVCIQANPSVRDIFEMTVVSECIKRNVSMVGICRGSQLLFSLFGGKLIQHVNFHDVRHSITDIKTGDEYFATSTHHQMWDTSSLKKDSPKFELIAKSTESRSDIYIRGNPIGKGTKPPLPEDYEEPEIGIFPDLKALLIQGHPEYLNKDEGYRQYCMNLVNDRL